MVKRASALPNAGQRTIGPRSVVLLSALLAVMTAAAGELRDPTRPGWTAPDPDAAQRAPAAPLLTAIVIGPQQRRALIGERFLQVGDRFGDATLIKIAFDYVVLRGSGGERTLRLTPLLDSRPAAKANGP